MTFKMHTSSPEATRACGVQLGARLTAGSTVELRSDLGGGKTTFIQGLAQGLGVTGSVASPTFTLSRVYPLPNGLDFYHFDLYRLSGSDVVIEELADSAGTPGTITAVEWADVAGSALPTDRLVITITPLSETERELTFTAMGPRHEAIIVGGLS